MEFFRKIAAGLVKHDINEFVGEQGNLFFSIDSGEFRLSDGVTPGGIVLGIPGSGSGGSPLLPATSTRLGGVKIGANINVGPDGTISVPTPFSGNYSALVGAPDLSIYQLKTDSFSGNYSDLTGKPFIPTVPTGLSGFANDAGYLTNADLATVAFTGDYNSLINKPTIPVIPTRLSDFVNDVGYITNPAVTWDQILNKPSFAPVAFNSDYNSLINKPTIPVVPTNLSAFNNNAGFITLADITWNNISNKPNWSTVAYTGSYVDLANKPSIPTDISQLTDTTNRLASNIPSQLGNGEKYLTTNGSSLSWATINIPTDISQLTDTNLLLELPDLANLGTDIIPSTGTPLRNIGTPTRMFDNIYANNFYAGGTKISTVNGSLVVNSVNGLKVATTGIIFPDGTVQSTAFSGSAITNIVLNGTSGTGIITSNLNLTSTNGMLATVSNDTVTINTPQDLRTTASPTFNTVNANTVSTTTVSTTNLNANSVSVGAGGITFPDGSTQTSASSGTGGGGGSSTGVIKTFNIIGDFYAPVPGTAIFIPMENNTIQSIQLVNSQLVTNQLQVGLYKNGLLIGTYSIVPGNLTSKYTALSIPVTTSDQLTCSVLTGRGNNFSMVLSSNF
jgi:hypothetical protein